MKIGLSLGGGGAKGAYQVGILKALEELNLINYINVFSGVSIGALNAYLYLSSNNVQTLYDAWTYVIKNNPFREKESFLDKDSKGFYKIDSFKEIAMMFADEKTFKTTNKDLFVVLTKVSEPQIRTLLKKSGREKVIIHVNKEIKALDYVLSSASIPLIFGFQEVDENYFVDGGITDNNSVDVLIEKGADIIFHSSFEKNLDFEEYANKNVTLIELTSMYAMPALRLTRFLSSVDLDIRLFDKRVKYGYFVTKSMIKYLINLEVLSLVEGKWVFKEIKGFNNITIPEEIHSEVKRMYKQK